MQAATYQIGISETYKQYAQIPSVASGDSILFNRGESFIGGFSVAVSDVYIGAYGTGENPIITGFTSVTSWTDLGSNIWESTNAVSALATCEMVTVNGVNTAKGRIPNYNNLPADWYFYQSYSGKTSITSSDLTGTPDWTGAEVAIKTSAYTLERETISSQIGGTLTISATTFDPKDNWGFFIQNDPRTLDVQNEWYYNPSTKKIRIYSTSEPSGVKVATVENLITIEPANITIDGIDFTGANTTAIYSNNRADNKLIKNCSISFCGNSGIRLYGHSGTVYNCTIDNCNNFGIDQSNNNNNTFRKCTITNTGTIVGMGGGFGGYNAIASGGSSNFALTIDSCSIINTGSNGLSLSGDSITINNNFIDNFCNLLYDGGGIYINGSYCGTYVNTISNNISINGGTTGSATYGTPFAEDPSVYPLHQPVHAQGIYIDFFTPKFRIIGNTMANLNSGMVLSGISDTDIQYNTTYNTITYTFTLANHSNTANTIRNNVFVQKVINRPLALFLKGDTEVDNTQDFAYFDYNVWAQPITDYDPARPVWIYAFLSKIWVGGSEVQYKRSFEEWQIFSGKDIHSTKSPQGITNENQLRFEYNETLSAKTVALSVPMIDMKGTKYYSSIILQPFTSAVLIPDANPIIPNPDPIISGGFQKNLNGNRQRSTNGKFQKQ